MAFDIANALQPATFNPSGVMQAVQSNRLAQAQDARAQAEATMRSTEFQNQLADRAAAQQQGDAKSALATAQYVLQSKQPKALLQSLSQTDPKVAEFLDAATAHHGIDWNSATDQDIRGMAQTLIAHYGSQLGQGPPIAKIESVAPNASLVSVDPNAPAGSQATPVYTAPEAFTGAPFAAVSGGKPGMFERGSAGTVRPVTGLTPYRASNDGGGPIDEADPFVQSWASTVLSGNATMAQVPMKYRNAVSKHLTDMPKEGYSPLASSRFTLAAERIAKNFLNLPQYQLTANGLPYLQRIDAALKTPGSVSDQDLLDSLTKLNTAGNAVTDAQVRVITDGKSFADMASTFANKFQNGGVLSPNQRQQISTIAKAIFANYQKGYAPVYRQLSSQLKSAGIPEQFWSVPDLNNLSAQIEGGGVPPTSAPTPQAGATAPVRVNTPAEAMALAPGTVFVTPDGRQKVR